MRWWNQFWPGRGSGKRRRFPCPDYAGDHEKRVEANVGGGVQGEGRSIVPIMEFRIRIFNSGLRRVDLRKYFLSVIWSYDKTR